VGDAAKYEVLCFPAFYRGGSALSDLAAPARVLLGSQDTPAGAIASECMIRFLSHWIPRESTYREPPPRRRRRRAARPAALTAALTAARGAGQTW